MRRLLEKQLLRRQKANQTAWKKQQGQVYRQVLPQMSVAAEAAELPLQRRSRLLDQRAHLRRGQLPSWQ
jgi:hypothetical protein